MEETRAAAHGEQVGYGLLVQLALESEQELADIWVFMGEVGLPRRLGELATRTPAIEDLARRATEGLWVRNFPRPLSAEDFADAIGKVEGLGGV